MDNKNLSDHFTLFDLTQTTWGQFQEMNRNITDDQVQKLTAVAKLLEHVMFVLNGPITVTSGYRCPDLNRAVGSTDRSQHLLCEAADFIPVDQELGACFRALWKDIKDNGANVGQLIHETAPRPGGYTSWLHISLGGPWREDSKNRQILRMENGKYTRLA